MDGYARHVKASVTPDQAVELAAVDSLAEKLVAHIVATSTEIATLHVHGAKSKEIQDHFAKLLREELGFGEEVVLTPQSGLVTHARPDFFFELTEGRGIIAEVERGGTTTNNHDLKDLWKAHVSGRPTPVPDRAAQQLEGGRLAKGASFPDRRPAAGSVLRRSTQRNRRAQRACVRLLTSPRF